MRNWKFRPKASETLGEALERVTKLPREQLAEASRKGAVWLQRGKGKVLRARSLNAQVTIQDTVSFFFEPRVLKLPELNEATCIAETEHFGVWLKEAGVVPQGTQTGDHASLLRYVEKKKKQDVYLVLRLDRETAGLMVIAYDSKTAAKLSELFQKNLVKKEYEAIVLGTLRPGHKQTIDVAWMIKRPLPISRSSILMSTIAW